MLLKTFLWWLPMIVIAFANATIREMIFLKFYTEQRAHQLSTVLLILLCTIYTWFIMPRLNIETKQQAISTGLIWILLTIAFEFTLGRLTNKSWTYLLRDYNILSGRLWLLFLMTLLFLPLIMLIWRKA